MARLTAPAVRVLIEQDGTADFLEYDVQTDNRDAVAWDMTRGKKSWPQMQDAPMLWATFVAWSALRRSSVITLNVDDFLSKCVQAQIITPDGEAVDASTADQVAVDPTQPGPESA